MNPIRVLLVEDNPLTRFGTAAVIRTQPDLQIVGEAVDGPTAVTSFRALRPDVVVLDLKLPGFDGVQVAAELASETPPPRILILSQYEGDESVVRALKAGALGYVTKDLDLSEIVLALRKVAAGERYVPGKIASRLAARVARPELSLRDLQILTCLCKGQSNRQIGEALSLTERTTAVYVSHLIGKLGVHTRQEAAALALKEHIVDL